MLLRKMNVEDKKYVMKRNKVITEKVFTKLVDSNTGFMIIENNEVVGFLDYSLLWNKMPFLNFLYISEKARRQGYGSLGVLCWETEMKNLGYKRVIVSTRADEMSQNLFRKLNYLDCGSIVFNEQPYKQPIEIFLTKAL